MATPTRPPPPQPPPPPLPHVSHTQPSHTIPHAHQPPHAHTHQLPHTHRGPPAPSSTVGLSVGVGANGGGVYAAHGHAPMAVLPPLAAPLQPLAQMVAAPVAPVPNYYDLYIGALEHSHRLQGALDAIRSENERLRERVSALERARPEQPKSQSRYWTPDEHQRFLEALQEYGPKDVRAIATYVGTRNATQVRTHAQKYWIRVQREEARRGGKHSLAAARRRCVSESDLAKVDRDTRSGNSPGSPAGNTPPVPVSPPRQRFPLPKPGRSPLAKKAIGVMDIVSSTEMPPGSSTSTSCTPAPGAAASVAAANAANSTSLPTPPPPVSGPVPMSIPVSSALPPTQSSSSSSLPRPQHSSSLPLPPPSMLSGAKPPLARTERDSNDCNSGIKLLSMVADRENQRVPMQQ